MSYKILEVDNIEKSYGEESVLDGVSFSMTEQDVLSIIGPSGSGKSTLLKCINRLVEIDRGKIHFEGRSITAPDTDVNDLRREIGMVFQEGNLFSHLTSIENITLGLKHSRGMESIEAEQVAEEYLNRVGLEDQHKAYPAELSGGQKQRVGIARALAMEPKIILFDEPTSSLDPELVSGVLDIIRELAIDGTTMIVVTHKLDFARTVSTDVLFLDGRRIVERGSPDKVLSNPESDKVSNFINVLNT